MVYKDYKQIKVRNHKFLILGNNYNGTIAETRSANPKDVRNTLKVHTEAFNS